MLWHTFQEKNKQLELQHKWQLEHKFQVSNEYDLLQNGKSKRKHTEYEKKTTKPHETKII